MKRNLTSLALFLLTLLLLGFHFLPHFIHEVLGILLPLAAIYHLWQNRRWFGALKRGRWTQVRLLETGVDWLLILLLILVTITGIGISNHLFREFIPLAWQRNIFLHQLHVSAPFWLLMAMGLHIGFHWSGLWRRFASWLGFDSTRRSPLSPILCPIVAAAGLYGAWLNRLGDRLLLKHLFATPATALPAPTFFLLLTCVTGLFVIIGHAVWRRLR